MELAALGQRAARELPDTHQHLQPQVMPYAQMSAMTLGKEGVMLALIQVFALMLLVLVCGNVALLLFARAATRESEILVRSALGASRRRIVAQLFAEALVLGGVAAAVGLAAAHVALRQWGLPFLEANMGRLPFWRAPGGADRGHARGVGRSSNRPPRRAATVHFHDWPGANPRADDRAGDTRRRRSAVL